MGRECRFQEALVPTRVRRAAADPACAKQALFIVVELTGLALDVNMRQNATKNHINTHYVNMDSQRDLCRNILRVSFTKRSRKSYMQ